jgi:hypothetical protein
MSFRASKMTVCGLAVLLSGLTIVGSAIDLQREHKEEDSWLLGCLHITLPREG